MPPMCLPRNGRPVMGDLRYLVDTKLEEFGTPLARAQLGAALAMLGDKSRAATAFKSALDLLDRQRTEEVWRADYGSKLRDSVATVALLAETNGARADIQRASLVAERAREAARFTSTQEQGWMVIAAQALAKDADGIALTVDGKAQTGALYRTVSQAKLDDAPISIVNTGQNALRAVVSVAGVPLTPEPATDQGFKIERAYYSMSGAPLDVSTVKQTTRFIVSLKVSERVSRNGRLLLVDPLPAGIEIDNPALVENTILPDAEWLKREVEPSNTEYRDDRFRGGFRSHDGSASDLPGGLYRACRLAGPLCSPWRVDRGHVSPRALRAYRDRHAGCNGCTMNGAWRALKGLAAFTALFGLMLAAALLFYVAVLPPLDMSAAEETLRGGSRSRRAFAASLHHAGWALASSNRRCRCRSALSEAPLRL